jgi:hypothetical protein
MTKVRIESDALQAIYKKWLDRYYPQVIRFHGAITLTE